MSITIDLRQMENMQRGAFSVAGVRALFDDSSKSAIPALWPRLIAALPLAGQVDGRSYGVMWSAGKTSYMAGVEIAGDAPLAKGFEKIEIAAQTYLVFRQTLDGSALHPQMQAAAKEIRGTRLPKLGAKLVHAPDFELYPEGFNPMRKGAYVDVYVPAE